MRNLLTDPLRIGLLGAGSFVQRRILPALQETGKLKVLGIYKRDFNAAKKIAEEYSISLTAKTRAELLTHPDIEAIFIGSSNAYHTQDAIDTANAKKPALCEKPLAPTVADIEKMIQAFRQNNQRLFVGHSLRFKPAIQKAKKMVQEKAFGELLHIKAYFTLPVPKDNWRYKKDCGGGVLQDIGVHLIDLIQFISGEDISSISALSNSSWDHNSNEAETTVLAQCHLTNGVTASFECSFEQPFNNGFEVIGTKSRLISTYSLRQTLDPIETLTYIQEDDSKLIIPLKASNIYVDELNHFAKSLIGEEETIIPAEIGLKNQRVIESAYHSLASGKQFQII